MARIRNQSGNAIVETLPLIFTLLILVRVSFGFWGAVHTGILNSIAAYNHAMTTFSFRSNLTYLRPGLVESTAAGTSDTKSYNKAQSRYHGVIDENKPPNDNENWYASGRSIGLDRYIAEDGTAKALMTDSSQCPGCEEINNTNPLHKKNTELYQQTADQNKKWTQFVWIKTVYGICLNIKCQRE